MPSITPSPTPRTRDAALALVDGCPGCVRNVEPPKMASRVGGAWRCFYDCSSCGNAWTTDWRD